MKTREEIENKIKEYVQSGLPKNVIFLSAILEVLLDIREFLKPEITSTEELKNLGKMPPGKIQ